MSQVLEYKCPCCDSPLVFGEQQKLSCDSCGNEFELETVQVYHQAADSGDSFTWEETSNQCWSEEEQKNLHSFECPSCGGQILAEDTTAATFCPYCDNPAVLPGRVSGGIRPDAIIPFQNTLQNAKDSFQKLCKGKPLLPKDFASSHRVERITGLYVPFWLYSCSGNLRGRYRATRVHHWSDSQYHYTKTSYFMLTRAARAAFEAIPMDGSSKMDNVIMESIEPFDYLYLKDFDPGYLTGFLADKYDVSAEECSERADKRAENTIAACLKDSVTGYESVTEVSKELILNRGAVKYALLPVWILNTKWNGKNYMFAMNGQTGKMVGDLPVDKKRKRGYFAAVYGVTALITLLFMLFPGGLLRLLGM